MSLTVYWTRFAENKIDDIYEYYEFKAGVSVALKLVNGIIDRTIGLEKNPYLGPKEKLLEKRKQEFRYLVFKNYKIIYWVNLNKKRIEVANNGYTQYGATGFLKGQFIVGSSKQQYNKLEN